MRVGQGEAEGSRATGLGVPRERGEQRAPPRQRHIPPDLSNGLGGGGGVSGGHGLCDGLGAGALEQVTEGGEVACERVGRGRHLTGGGRGRGGGGTCQKARMTSSK
jgi:hypothetical protein